MSETSAKLGLLRDLAARKKLDAILLKRVSSVAWATGGASMYVNTARTTAETTLLITARDQYLITNNIEAVRLEKEENLASQGWKFTINPWFEKENNLSRWMNGRKLGTDDYHPGAMDLSVEIAHLRANLVPEEVKRFKVLGELCAQAMDAATRAIHPGQTEYEIAGILSGEAARRGAGAIVNLIAVDERIFNFRHPLPTDKKLEHYAMLVLCGRRWGLVCSLTRFVHYGKLPEEIRRKAQAVARVDASMIAATQPGSNLGEVFRCAQQTYAEVGYPDEWRLHHQGGLAGYEPRETIATPGSTEIIRSGQVYAWNPSITGYKSEDSVLIGEDGFDILTIMPGWPVLKVEVAGQTIERPDILTVD
jgi:Xaa-Pro aminopeptidase